jgi:hypothetical protein
VAQVEKAVFTAEQREVARSDEQQAADDEAELQNAPRP